MNDRQRYENYTNSVSPTETLMGFDAWKQWSDFTFGDMKENARKSDRAQCFWFQKMTNEQCRKEGVPLYNLYPEVLSNEEALKA